MLQPRPRGGSLTPTAAGRVAAVIVEADGEETGSFRLAIDDASPR